MKQLSTKQIWLITSVFFLGFGYMGHLDYQDQLAAIEHAQYVKSLAKAEAKAEADERKREFNRLAFEAERMTGFAGDMK